MKREELAELARLIRKRQMFGRGCCATVEEPHALLELGLAARCGIPCKKNGYCLTEKGWREFFWPDTEPVKTRPVRIECEPESKGYMEERAAYARKHRRCALCWRTGRWKLSGEIPECDECRARLERTGKFCRVPTRHDRPPQARMQNYCSGAAPVIWRLPTTDRRTS